MGYRLYVHTADGGEYCLGKLYGYPNHLDGDPDHAYWAHEELPSAEYLVSIGKLNEEDLFGYGFDRKIGLSGEEYREFARLYDADHRLTAPVLGYDPDRIPMGEGVAGVPGPKWLEWC